MKLPHGLSKKGIIIAAFCCLTTLIPQFVCAAQKSADESKQGTFSGDYVIYRDYSWKAPTWVGFLYYNDETYGAFINTPEKNSAVSILFSGKAENGTLSLTGQQIISPITPDDTLAVNYLMTLLPKLYELRRFPRSEKIPYATEQSAATIEEFGGAVTLQFCSFVPLFHLHAMTGAKKEAILELIEMGSIKNSSESAFYGYMPAESKQGSNTFKRDKAAKKETMTVSDIALHLDSQWKKIADNSFLCGNTAFLTVSTLTLPPAEAGNPLSASEQLIRLVSGSSQYAKPLLPYTVIKGTPQLFTITQSVYDVESKKISKDIKRCIKNKNGTVTIISLTVDSSAYSAEQAYFDGLF